MGSEGKPLLMPSFSEKVSSDWKWDRLDSIAHIYDCPHSTPLLVADLPSMYVVRSQDVRTGQILLKDVARVSPETYEERIKRAEPTFGDLVYSREGTYFGIAAEVPKGTKMCLGQRMVLIRPDRKKINHTYLKYWLNSPQISAHICGFRDGTVAERLNLPVIRGLPVAFPSLLVQENIAESLSMLDDRITLLRETNTTLEAIAQALFKSWFVDFDPVHAKQQGRIPEGMDEATAALFPDSFEESELGLVPKGWRVSQLDKIAEYLNGLALQKFPPTGSNDLPVIKIAQLRKGDTVGADLAGRTMKSEYIIQNGDVLCSWSGSLEVEIWCGGEGALNQHLFKVTSKDFPKWFYYLWTSYHLANFQLIAASKATTMGHIQRKHLTEAATIVPSTNVLEAANEVLHPLIERLINNALQAQNLATLRDALLPRLISGALRLPSGTETEESMPNEN
jgi:type I restriction enzyme S subunit